MTEEPDRDESDDQPDWAPVWRDTGDAIRHAREQPDWFVEDRKERERR